MTDQQRRDDAEQIEIEAARLGPPVDPPPVATTWADIVTRPTPDLPPVVPAWLRSPDQRGQVIRQTARYAGHITALQARKTPKYAAKAALWAPVGAGKLLYRSWRWAYDMEQWSERQAAANRLDDDAYLRLMHQADRHRRARVPVWFACLALLIASVALVALVAPWWLQTVLSLAGLITLAWAGRPADRPILDRVSHGQRYIRLTAEMTRAALVACGAGIKDPGAVKFQREIHTEGPGHLALVELPPGIIATDVIDKRDRLAQGFRLPIDQVWPDPVRGEHPGVLAIWVANRPVSAMRQPAWPLLEEGIADYFAPMPYGADVKLRPVTWSLAERNSLFGGMPGSGKSLAARNVLLGAVLDPLVITVISELKGSGDYDCFEPLCPKGLYISGADGGSIRSTMDIIEWLHGLCEERGPLVAKYARQGMNSVKKVNRAMAEHDARLRPVVALFDEVQEFMSSKYGIKGDGAPMLLSTIKRARALGIHVIVATQRFDKDSLPKAISSLVSNRAALAVPAQPETDMILGTSAYRTGARPNLFVPGEDSGWMVRAGFTAGYETVRAAFVDDDQAAAVCARALAMRSGGRPDVAPVRAAARNLLEDVREVWPAGEDALWSELIVPRLVALDSQTYGDLTVEIFGARMRAAGVATVSLHRKIDGKGTTRAGVRREALETGLKARQITDS